MKHNHTETCCCHEHHHGRIKLRAKWSFSLVFVLAAVFLIKPFIVNRIINSAEAYTAYGLYEDAVRQYHKSLFIDSKNSDIWNSLGNSYKNLGIESDAVYAYRNAIEIDPGNRAALFNLGMISMLRKDYLNAMPYFEKELEQKNALRLPPDTIFFHLGRLTHMSFSCVGCGLCSDVCPVDIPVSQVFKRTGEQTAGLFEYVAGRDVEESIPVLVYKEEEFLEIGED